MNQCSNCSSDNQITIAGKTFCANCGTPAEPKSSQTANLAQSPTDKPVKTHSANLATGLDEQKAPSIEPLAAAPTEVVAPKLAEPATISTANKASLPQPESTPPTAQESIASSPSLTPAPQPVTSSPQPNSTIQPQTKAAAEITSKVQQGHDETSLQRLLEGQKAPNATTQPQPTPAVSRVAPIKNLDLAKSGGNSTTENVGSELGGLDNKNEAVFSDAQLNELAKVTQGNSMHSTMAAQPRAKVMSDIRPAGNPAVEYIPPKNQTPEAQAAGLAAPATPAAKAVNSTQPPSILPPTTRAGSQISDIKQAPHSDRVVEMGLPAHLVPKSDEQSGPAPQPNRPAVGDKKPSFKPASVALSLIGVVVVGLYIWQINYPNLAFKVASGKAGINASLPNYLPSGWKVSGDIQASPGLISYNVSNSNSSQQMQVQEAKTDWDSQALAENYVTQKSDNYLALQAQGLTIYMYGNNHASWINNGTWYRLEGNTNGLSQDQLIKIATSL